MQYREPFRLSNKGSTRATAYPMGNKIVTLGDRTHVVWLDAIAQVRARTYDHGTETWGDTVDLFEGCDNHTHPVLTASADQHLHLVYGPHGRWGNWNQGCFKHLLSSQPNSVAGWESEQSFGYNATYASMISLPSGLDAIVYRGGETPASLMFQLQRKNGGWSATKELMAQDITPQYTHVGATIVSDSTGVIYAGGHFYNMDTDARSGGVAVLRSTDSGVHWTDMEDRPVGELPILYQKRFFVPHDFNPDSDVRLAGLGVDGDDQLWAATSGNSSAFLSCWTPGCLKTLDLAPFMPEDRIPSAGPLVIDTSGRIHMAVSLSRKTEEGESWGHPSLEIFHLVSSDGGEIFECNQISPPDEELSSWLPSISMAGPHHPVDNPVIMYMHCVKGEGCSPPDETEVYCVMVE